jgi:hypothetical protein
VGEELINEEKAIVLDVIICGVGAIMVVLKLPAEVITNVSPEGVPEGSRIGGKAVTEDGNKEVAEGTTCLHVLGLIKTLVPFLIILQETTCKTCLSERWSLNALESAEVLEAGGAPDSSEEKAEIEALSSSGLDIVQPANCIATLPWFHLSSPFVLHINRGAVLVEKVVTDIWILCIGFEEGSEGGLLCSAALQDLLCSLSSVLIPCDSLLVGKMDMKADDVGGCTMHGKVEEPPDSLMSRNVAGIQVELDLIVAGAELHSDSIMALVDIFVDVLQGLDGGDDLNVDVATILPYEIPAVGDDPAIVNILVPDAKGLASV